MYGCVCVCVINKKKVLTNTRIQLQNRMRVKNRKFVCLPHLLGDGGWGWVCKVPDRVYFYMLRDSSYIVYLQIQVDKLIVDLDFYS
jgi:hypothetical protein